MKSKEEISYIALQVYKAIEKVLYDYNVDSGLITSLASDIEKFVIEELTNGEEITEGT